MKSKHFYSYINGAHPGQEMTKPTLLTVYNKLFEDGDFYITDHYHNMVGFERDSVIIHPCPSAGLETPEAWPDTPLNLTMVLPFGECEPCNYCNQVPSDALVAVYKLQNWDHFANDTRETGTLHFLGTKTRKFSSRGTRMDYHRITLKTDHIVIVVCDVEVTVFE